MGTHIDVIARVDLLVHRMRAIISSSNRKQQDVQVEDICEIQGNGDRPAFTRVIGCLAVDRFSGSVGSLVRVVLLVSITILS